ncbi:MAG: alanine racemase [Lachnospiraceae bacterium]|jgi:predicted amino acid racemase|nr:alanine racemase [Lachnospiraceae bacterium]MCI7092815.1 alanine racemase [Lachnospiraceae bacterium]
MFLNKLIESNPEFLKDIIELHQKNELPANSYAIDLDTVYENAKKMVAEAHKYGIKVYPMTKQIGRNPAVIRTLKLAGCDGCVCVDMADARRVHAAGMKIGHLGHLVQVPKAEIDAAILMQPEYWTVFDLEKARVISDHMPEGWTQKIMLRIFSDGDTFYTGHEGGIPASEVVEAAKKIGRMPGLKFAGITTFPTQLYNLETQTVEHTHNYRTLLEAKKALEAAGFTNLELNAPGTTSLHLFKEMGEHGVTQVEPGHGLTGSTPIHAVKAMAERPALAYVSEICHFYNGRAYCYGGGMYIDPVFPPYMVRAMVGSDFESAKKHLIECDMPKPEAIDYYGIFKPAEGIKEGDTVIFGFRAQAFVTRAFVVPISGVSKGSPKIEGIYDSDGKEMGWPYC